MKPFLFSYGTLQKEKVQVALFGRIFQGTTDTLNGYKVVAVEIEDESFLSRGEEKQQLTAIVSNAKNNCIKGTVLELKDEELLVADSYEPEGYKRAKVLLASGREAWIYQLIVG